MGFRVLFSLFVISSYLTINVVGAFDLDRVTWRMAPHYAPSYSPVEAPAPLHHHKGPGGHHHKPAVPPTAHSPSVAPVHPPIKAPFHPPTKAPVRPPIKAPFHPPIPLPLRRQVAVRGMVYCKACKYRGIDTLMAATPLQGAKVLLTCKNTKYPLRVNGTTDKNGFFFIMPPKKLTTFGIRKCVVTLLSSPKATCNRPTNLHYGVKGAVLVPTPPKPVGSKLPYDVFTVGPFAYETSKKTVCPH